VKDIRKVQECAKLIREKLVTVQKKEDVVKAKEEVLAAKIQAYEKITELVERGLRTLDDENISFKFINREFIYLEKEIHKLEKERSVLSQRVLKLDRGIRSIEQNLSAKRFLLEFKAGDEAGLVETIEAQDERLRAATDELALTKIGIELIDSQLALAKDYFNNLQEKHLEFLKEKLLVRRQTNLKAKEAFLGGFLFLLFIFMRFKSLKVGLSIQRATFFQRLFQKTLKVILFQGLVLSPLYLFSSYAGYRGLFVYVCKNIILIEAIALILIIAHNRIIKGVSYLYKGHVSDSGKNIPHPVTSILNAVFGCFFVFLGIYCSLKIFASTDLHLSH